MSGIFEKTTVMMADDIETVDMKDSDESGTGKPEGFGETRIVELNDEEDVPPDFFDDFSNQDFMEGLDIVDTWDEEGQLPDSPVNEDEDKDKYDKSDDTEIEGEKKRIIYKSHSRERNASVEYYVDLRDKLKRRTQHEELKEKHAANEEKRMLGERARRDPEKTRRDILKDKDKCAKDKEVKIINEKLKVVETGLVPPGMEMEVDLKELRKKQETLRKQETVKHEEPGRRPSVPDPKSERYKSRSRSAEIRRYPRERRPRSSRSHSRSRNRVLRRSRERPYERFPHSRSPRRRPRSRSRSPYFPDKRYIVIRARESSPRIKSRERLREVSPRSDLSDREKWQRRGSRRSVSPVRRKRSRSIERYKLEKMAREKKSFLEEIHQKLNETTPRNVPQNQMIPPSFTSMVPQPVTVSQPQQFVNPQMVPPPQYDQQFFIGPCEVPQPVRPSMFMPQSAPCPVPMPMNYENPSSTLEVHFNVPAPNVMDTQMKINQEEEDKRALNKLFEDKKISLSDYLSLRAKTADARPVNLQNKINVITRCQEIVKELGGDSKLSGRFFLKRTICPDRSPDLKFQSPLRRLVSRLHFTTIVKPNLESTGFSNMLNKLLRGTKSQTVAEHPPKEEDESRIAFQHAPPQMQSVVPLKKVLKKPRNNDLLFVGRFLSKMVQTEPMKCQVCEVRASRRTADTGVQCDTKSFSEMSVQVTDEDLSPWKNKNKSLALLTPAQILAQEEMKKDVFAHSSPKQVQNRPGKKANKSVPPEKFVNRGRGGFSRRGSGYRGGSSKSRPFYEPPEDLEFREGFDTFRGNRFSDRRFEESFDEDFHLDDDYFDDHESFHEADMQSFHDSPEGSTRGGRFGYKRKRKFW